MSTDKPGDEPKNPPAIAPLIKAAGNTNADYNLTTLERIAEIARKRGGQSTISPKSYDDPKGKGLG